MKSVFRSKIEGSLLCEIIHSPFASKTRYNFFTEPDADVQVAAMSHEDGYVVSPHIHRAYSRNLETTSEVLVIVEGCLEVTIFDVDKTLVAREDADQGSIIILYKGGHGFVAKGDLKMIEVKQGPFAGSSDKDRF